MQAVILAGGRGMRMRPYTEIVPKPLLSVGGTAAIEILVQQLIQKRFKTIWISLGYQAKLVKAFIQGCRFNADIRFVHEHKRMGTAGCLGLLKGKTEPHFLVVNGDIFTDFAFDKFFRQHCRRRAYLSLAVCNYTVNVPYGHAEINGDGTLRTFREKPELIFKVGAGIYACSAQMLEDLPDNSYCDFPYMFKKADRAGRKIFCSTMTGGYWKDLGRPDDFAEANAIFNGMRRWCNP
jgi:NDP-sugar pyrophosphorylase family protein